MVIVWFRCLALPPALESCVLRRGRSRQRVCHLATLKTLLIPPLSMVAVAHLLCFRAILFDAKVGDGERNTYGSAGIGTSIGESAEGG